MSARWKTKSATTRESCSCVCEPYVANLPFPNTCSTVIAFFVLTKQNPTLPRQSLDIRSVSMHAMQINASKSLVFGSSISRSGEVMADLWRLTAYLRIADFGRATKSTTASTL